MWSGIVREEITSGDTPQRRIGAWRTSITIRRKGSELLKETNQEFVTNTVLLLPRNEKL